MAKYRQTSVKIIVLIYVDLVQRQGLPCLCFNIYNFDPNVLYVACIDPYDYNDKIPENFVSAIWRTNDCTVQNPVWTDITPGLAGLRGGFITSIAVNPHDANEIWVGISHANQSGYKKLYHKVVGSTDWAPMSTGLPDPPLPVNDIEIDYHGNLYAATDIGVFYKARTSTEWTEFGGLKKCITDIEINHNDAELYACVFGRGMWAKDISCWGSVADELNPLDIYTQVAVEEGTFYDGCFDIHIFSGGIFTINGLAVMSPFSKIRVKSGGKLIVNGGMIYFADIVVESGGILEIKNGGYVHKGVDDEVICNIGGFFNFYHGSVKSW